LPFFQGRKMARGKRYYIKHDTNFNAPDAHFDYLRLFSDAQVEKKMRNPIKM
jgi:hypothetical protein